MAKMKVSPPPDVVTFEQASRFIDEMQAAGHKPQDPPTERQKQFLSKHGLEIPDTKEKASEELTKIWSSGTAKASDKQIALIRRLDPSQPAPNWSA